MGKINFVPEIAFDGFQRYYNLTEKKHYCITMDIDWASDEVLEWTFDWFIKHEIAITAFATHLSDVVLKYSNHPLIEIGIHPNFSKNIEPVKKIEALCNSYTFSTGSRSHRNIIGRDFTDALKLCGIKYDASCFLWGAKNVELYPLYNGMIQVPYVWEDGVHMELNESSDYSKYTFETAGLKVLNIHPVLFFLNHTSFDELKKFTSKYSELNNAPFNEYLAAQRKEFGMGDFSRKMFLSLKKNGGDFFLIKEAALPAYEAFQSICNNRKPNWN